MTLARIAAVTAGAALVDQAAKQAVRGMPEYTGTDYPRPEQRRQLPGGLLVHVEHDGTKGMVGWVNKSPKSVRYAMFAAAPVAGLAAWHLAGRTSLAALGAGLFIGGGLSNGVEHAVKGTVTDQFAFHRIPFGIFNLADVSILAGAVCLVGAGLGIGRGGGGPRRAGALAAAAVAGGLAMTQTGTRS